MLESVHHIMKTNQLSARCVGMAASLLCVALPLIFGATSASAQNAGDWQTVPGLASAYWTNSNPNANGNDSSWQMWNGSQWVTETGKTDAVDYPDNNTGVINILPGIVLTNDGSVTVQNVTVQSGAYLYFYKATFNLNHNGATTYDMDVLGTWGISNSTAALISLNSGATIAIESGASVTNFGGSTGDVFGGPGYGTSAILFKNGSTYVQSGSKATSVPLATWAPNSTFIFAPYASANTGFTVTGGWTGSTFGNFIWNWPTQPAKVGTSSAGEGTVTFAGNFYIANANAQTNENIPGPNATLTVGGNFGITNVSFFPSASSGVSTINIGGNFIVDSTAVIKMNNSTALGNVTFDGAHPQLFSINGSNGSPGSWNWTVASGSTVNLTTPLTVNYGESGTAGTLTVDGVMNLASTGSISGNSNTIVVAQGGTLNVAGNASGLTLGSSETLTGAGTIAGNVTAGAPSTIHPNSGLPLTFANNLTYSSSQATNIFNLTATPGAGNDEIILNGVGATLTCDNAQVAINSAGTLSTTTDYVLYNVTGAGGSIAGSFNATPLWLGTPPANSNNYTVVTSGKQVLLHYGTVAAPRPGFTTVAVSGANLLVNGTNGASGTYVLLTTTNLASQVWTPVATNVLTGSGNFSFTATNAVIGSDKQQFYILKGP